jgi:hypothetical protein
VSFRLAALLGVALLPVLPSAARAQGARDTARVTVVYTGRSLGALGERRAQDEHELLTEEAASEGLPVRLVSHMAWRAPGVVIFFSGEEPNGDELPWILAHRAEAEAQDGVRALVSANALLVQDPWRPQPSLLDLLDRNPRRARDFPDLVPTRVRVSRLRTPDDHRVFIVELPGATWLTDPGTWTIGEMNRVDVGDTRLFELPINLGGIGPRATLLARVALDARTRGEGVITADLGHQEAGLDLPRAARAELNFAALDRLGYQAVVPYTFELSLGGRELAALTARHARLRLLAANVRATDSTLFRGWDVVEAGGVRVGLLGLVNPRVRDRLPRGALGDFTFEAPAVAARRAVDSLRARGVQAVVALSNMEPVDNAALAEDVVGIDAIVADLPVRWAPEAAEVRVTLPERPFARPGAPALIARSAANGLGVGALTLDVVRGTTGRPHLAALSHRLATVTDQVPSDTALVCELSELAARERRPRGELLIPAFADLVEAAPQLQQADATTRQGRISKALWESFLARLLRHKGRAEVAVIRRLEQFPPLVGKLHENEVDAWLWTEDQVVLVDVTGADLRALLRDDPRGELATSGVDLVAGTIQGHRIDDNTYYRVATTDVLFDGARGRPLARGRRVRRKFAEGTDGALLADASGGGVLLRDVALGELRRVRAHGKAAQVGEVAALFLPDPPYVSLLSFTFDRPTLWASSNQVRGGGDYSQVPDARVNSRTAWTAGVSGRVVMTHERERTATDIGLALAYARQGVQAGAGENVTTIANDIRLDATLRPSVRAMAGRGPQPFVRLGLNTEFTPTLDPSTGLENNRKMALRGSSGFLLPPRGALRRAELAVAIEDDFGRPNLQYGLQSVFQSEWKLGAIPGASSVTGVTYRLRNDVTWFLPAAADNASHLALRENMVHELLIPLVDELSLSVAADLYLFQGKVPLTGTPGFSAQLRVGITYDRLWKPRYQPFL